MSATTTINCETAIPDCGLTCEELTCELNAVNANITKLFSRTEDLRGLFQVVTTEDELTVALAIGGTILIGESIVLTGTATVSVDETTLLSFPIEGNGPIELSYPHVSGESHNVLMVEAKNAKVLGLSFTTGHPLSSDNSDLDVGIKITDSSTIDCSGLVIEGCKLYGLHSPIKRNGATNSKQLRNGRIANNEIYSFCDYGVIVNYNTDNFIVEENDIYGRADGETHDVTGNGIWIGNFADYARVIGNKVREVDRNAIEVWNSPSAPANTGGNINPIISDNRVGVIAQNTAWGGFAGAFGITVIGSGVITIVDNVIEETNGTAIEVYTDDTNDAIYVVEGNTILSVVSDSAPNAISIESDSATNKITCLISGNTIGRTESNTVGVKQFGIQILGGSLSVVIDGNTFNDSGNHCIYANGDGVEVFEGIVITNNTFNWSTSAPFEAGNYSVLLQDIMSTAVLKNNQCFRPAGSLSGYYIASGTGTVLTGGPAIAPILATGPGADVAGDSNLEIDRL